MPSCDVANPGLAGRILSASVGSTAVALTVTPLDVARVRMQTAAVPQRPLLSSLNLEFAMVGRRCFAQTVAGVAGLTGELTFTPRLLCGDVVGGRCFAQAVIGATGLTGELTFTPRLRTSMTWRAPPGMLQTLQAVATESGARGLYAGLPATMIIGIPSNVAYFSTYEAMRNRLQSLGGSLTAASIVAGGTSRAVAVTACAPLEVLRTRIQAGQFDGQSSIVQDLRGMMQREGPSVMFRGLRSTLWRDVPFSAFYWLGVEAIRSALLRRGFWADSSFQAPASSLVASATAGAASAFLTTPFDVVKTRLQVEVAPNPQVKSTGAVLRQVFREGGIGALFAGAAPRTARVAPACAIMLGSYEMTKLMLQ